MDFSNLLVMLEAFKQFTWQNGVMIAVGGLLIFLAIAKKNPERARASMRKHLEIMAGHLQATKNNPSSSEALHRESTPAS